MIKIENGLPVPPPRGKVLKYPFAKMAVGESFIVTDQQRLVSAAASDFKRKHGWKFTTRKVEGGTRCWRVA